jgi:hypothetical protein
MVDPMAWARAWVITFLKHIAASESRLIIILNTFNEHKKLSEYPVRHP